MDELIKSADEARMFWADNELDDYDYVLLLPHNDERLNTVMYNTLLKRLKTNSDCHAESKAVVLTVGRFRKSEYYTSIAIDSKTAENILKLYCMYQFTDKLIIGSFELPYGRKLENLLDCHVASEAELTKSVIFGIK